MQLRRVVYVVATLIAAFVVMKTMQEPVDNTPSTPSTNLLTEVDQDHFRSPAGLIYGPGSRHGHRLKHVVAHGSDEPNRPGPHGVFKEGDQTSIVELIDEAYLASSQRGKSRNEGNRQVLTVEMGRPIGYVGGQVGRRSGNPVCHHVRIVLEGMDVITAYPVNLPPQERVE